MPSQIKVFRRGLTQAFVVAPAGAKRALVIGAAENDDDVREYLGEHGLSAGTPDGLEVKRMGEAYSVKGFGAPLLFTPALEKVAALPGVRELAAETVVFPFTLAIDTAPLFSTLKAELGGDSPSDPPIARLSIDKYFAKASSPSAHAENARWIDVREPDECQESSLDIEGWQPRNLPLGELALHLAELGEGGKVYLSCFSGRRSLWATRTLARLIKNAEFVQIDGGIQAWTAAGYPTAKGKSAR